MSVFLFISSFISACSETFSSFSIVLKLTYGLCLSQVWIHTHTHTHTHTLLSCVVCSYYYPRQTTALVCLNPHMEDTHTHTHIHTHSHTHSHTYTHTHTHTHTHLFFFTYLTAQWLGSSKPPIAHMPFALLLAQHPKSVLSLVVFLISCLLPQAQSMKWPMATPP
jgi:hypothetical protein